jgi:hypothetical protein
MAFGLFTRDSCILQKSKASRDREAFSNKCVSVRNLLLRGLGFGGFGFAGVALGVFAAEAFYAAGGIHELLLAGKERMAGGADFYAYIALVSGAGDEGVAAGAMDADFTIVGMNGCFHDVS